MVFFDHEEWRQHHHDGSIRTPMHYVGVLQQRAHEAWLARYGYQERYPHLIFFSTLDYEEIRVTDTPLALKNLRGSQVVKSTKRPEASLEFIVATLERASTDLRALLANCQFGIMPSPMLNAGVQPSPSGGTVVMVQDGVFMSPWAYGKLDAAANAALNLFKGNRTDSTGCANCWEMLYASMCLTGQVAGPSILEEASRDGKADLSLMDRAGGLSWPASEVYGDGKSKASMLCGMLAIFIVAHEIGHLALGHVDRYRNFLLGDSSSPPSLAERQQQELDADNYAMRQWLAFAFEGQEVVLEGKESIDLNELAESLFQMFLPLAIAERASARWDEHAATVTGDSTHGVWALTGSTHPSWDVRLENVLRNLSAEAGGWAVNWRRRLLGYADAIVKLAADYRQDVPIT